MKLIVTKEMNTAVTHRIRITRCTLENSIYGLIAHSSMMLKQLVDNGNSSEEVLEKMHVGWVAYVQAFQEYQQECNPPPPLPPPRQPTQGPALAHVSDSPNTTATETIKCDICYDQLHNQATAVLNPCGHMFHNLCVEQWLQRRQICPYCRQGVDSIDHN